MKKSINVILVFALFLVAAVAISGCAQYGGQQPQAPPAAPAVPTAAPPTPPASPQHPQQQVAAAGVRTVVITATGFNPATLTIKAGETVMFLNQDTAPHWPASAMHPTHTVYPEPGGCIGSKFDACKGLGTGQPFMFKFNEKGSWKYHDHLNPSLWGTIVVE